MLDTGRPVVLNLPPPRGYTPPSGGRYLRKPRLVHVPREVPGFRGGRYFKGPIDRLDELVRSMTKRHKCYVYWVGEEFVVLSPFELEGFPHLIGVYTASPGIVGLREDLGR